MLRLAFILFTCLWFNSQLGAQGAYPVLGSTMEDRLVNPDILGVLGDRIVYISDQQLWLTDGTKEGTVSIDDNDVDDIQFFAKTEDAWYLLRVLDGMYVISKIESGSAEMTDLVIDDERIFSPILHDGQIFFGGRAEDDRGNGTLVTYYLESSEEEVLTTLQDELILSIGSFGEDLLYTATDGVYLTSDSGEHTVRILNEDFNSFSSPQTLFIASDGDMAFFTFPIRSSDYFLYATDGSEEGTVRLGAYDEQSFRTKPIGVGEIGFANGKFFYILREKDAPSGSTFELHVSDGTPEGTFNLDGGDEGYWDPKHFLIYKDKAYFNALIYSYNLMVSDGTLEGTEIVHEAFGHEDGNIGFIWANAIYNDQLVFKAFTEDLGAELYVSDGTFEGTELLVDVVPGEEGSTPRDMVQVGDLLYFLVTIDNGHYLWAYDPKLTTSTIDEEYINDVRVYPNPNAQKFITIELDLVQTLSDLEIKIVDRLGKRVLNYKFKSPREQSVSLRVPVEGISAGAYHIMLFDGSRLIATDQLIRF